MKERWQDENVKAFVDTTGTSFIKGPWEFDIGVYDYKLIDSNGEDYCTVEQMKYWDVKFAAILGRK